MQSATAAAGAGAPGAGTPGTPAAAATAMQSMLQKLQVSAPGYARNVADNISGLFAKDGTPMRTPPRPGMEDEHLRCAGGRQGGRERRTQPLDCSFEGAGSAQCA